MLVCLDGISGAGKSALLSELEQAAAEFGIPTERYHFFSDIPRNTQRIEEDHSVIERALFHPNADAREQAALFRRLCELACDGFLSSRYTVAAQLTLVERSPLSYYAYLQGSLRVPGDLSPSFQAAVAALQPVVLTVDVEEARRRTRLRDGAERADFVHNLSVERATAVQCAFIEAADRFGITHCEPALARDRFLMTLQQGRPWR